MPGSSLVWRVAGHEGPSTTKKSEAADQDVALFAAFTDGKGRSQTHGVFERLSHVEYW